MRRYKRFFADVETEDGVLTVHCPNPGRMLGLLEPGSPVRCCASANPARRLAHTLEMIRVGRTWVGLHTLRANAIAARSPGGGLRAPLGLRRAALGGEGGASRLDFALSRHARGLPDALVEVKSVTLSRTPGVAELSRLRDRARPTPRRAARALAPRGARAVLLFVVQRADCELVESADDIDPGYGARCARRRRRASRCSRSPSA